MCNNKNYIVAFTLTLLLFMRCNGYAQNITLHASIDTNIIKIGDQTYIKLNAVRPSNILLQFPILDKQITDKIEIVEKGTVDTLENKNNELKLQQKLLITSFDSGTHIIPPFKFLVKIDTVTDTIKTSSLILNVLTVEVDTTKDIKDIKPPLKAPLSIAEIWYYIVITLLIILLIIGIIYYMRKHKKQEPLIKLFEKTQEPPHIIALHELEKLKEEKLWQQNKIKEYYTKLTEIIRIYIEHRFSIPAMEQTSDEIIEAATKSKKIEQANIDLLRMLFTLADLVKFAKAHPLPDENDSAYQKAYDFVINTKLEEFNTNENNQQSTVSHA